MILRFYKVPRLNSIRRLIDFMVSPIIFVVDEKVKSGGYFRIQTLSEYLNEVYYQLENFVNGGYSAYSFEDEHFLSYKEVFGEE